MQATIEFNPDELDRKASDPRLADTVKKGVITKIGPMSAGEAYGAKAKDPDRMGINIQVKIPELDREFHEFIALPTDDISWLNKKFKMRLFRDRYGKVPRVGMEISCIVNADGFFRILL